MTHNEWENGKRLTVNNATKEQLKWMVEDRDAKIKRLYEELQNEKDLNQSLAKVLGEILESKGETHNENSI